MRVLLVANAIKQTATGLASARDWLAAQGMEFEQITSEHLVLHDPFSSEWKERVQQFDLVVSFGGDGTILRVARMIGASKVPLMAFNFGGMGFLASDQSTALLQGLNSFASGAFSLDARTLAAVDISYADGSTEQQLALNEAVISRGNFGRIVSLDLLVNTVFLDRTRGDGVLVATATGSTAYALSAGGPLISPHYDGLVIVPIAPHTLKAWSVVTGPADIVTLRPSAENAQRLVLFLDGEVLWSPANSEKLSQPPAEPGSLAVSGPEILSISVRPSAAQLQIVRFTPHDFYSQIAQNFFGDGPTG
ncbi:MAG: NAD(+)/NADH kinase [Actinomycetia bacterium]|nr:NAD(+)/NADH kinase [Actinomycetes bacterium]